MLGNYPRMSPAISKGLCETMCNSFRVDTIFSLRCIRYHVDEFHRFHSRLNICIEWLFLGLELFNAKKTENE